MAVAQRANTAAGVEPAAVRVWLVEPGGCDDWAPEESDWCIYCGEILDGGRCHRRELPPHPDESGLTRR